jgi:2-aminophenol/2-amino-5-chlorophenol 1,6-dioxygenase alpha subunit
MAKGTISRGYLVPGLPHLVFADKLGGWQELKRAYSEAGARAKQARPDVYVIYSSQWISVLGHSFQTCPALQGLHVDENWYPLGDLPYSLKVSVSLGETMAEKAKAMQLATKTVNFAELPIDSGTIVSQKFFNPDNSVPVGIVSCNVYANYADSVKLGQAAAEAVSDLGLNAVAIACTGLSSRFFTKDISPGEDRISDPKDDDWNRRILEMAGSGKNKGIVDISGEFASQAMADMGFKAFSWLMGALGTPSQKANVLGYGPVWGTGAAVVEYDMASA